MLTYFDLFEWVCSMKPICSIHILTEDEEINTIRIANHNYFLIFILKEVKIK